MLPHSAILAAFSELKKKKKKKKNFPLFSISVGNLGAGNALLEVTYIT